MLKKVADGWVTLTLAEVDLFLLYNHIHSHEVLPASTNNGVAQQIEETSDNDQATCTANLHTTK